MTNLNYYENPMAVNPDEYEDDSTAPVVGYCCVCNEPIYDEPFAMWGDYDGELYCEEQDCMNVLDELLREPYIVHGGAA